LLKSKFNMSW